MDNSKKDLTSNECFDSAIMSRAEPSRAEPSRAEPSRAEPSRAEPSRAEPSRAEPSRAEPSRAEPSRAEPSRAEPSRAEPSRAEPSRAEPSRAEPSRAEPSQQPLERHGVTPRPNAPPPAYRKPRRLAVPALLALLAALAAGPAAAQTSITLVSNTGQADGGTSGALEDFDQAQAFTTGGNTTGYTLTGVDIRFGVVGTATASYDVSIRTDDSGSPGTLVGDLTSPATLVADALNAFTTTGIDLAAGTTYFVLVDSSSAANNVLRNTAGDNEDSGGQFGWSIADVSVYRSRTSTGGWTDFDHSKKIAIKGYAKGGTTLSTDATLSALEVDGVPLDPTFVSSTETYTATVGPPFTWIWMTATRTASGATVAFEDGDGSALTNPVPIADGDNVIKVVVTAEDTTTMKTYMVTVTREAATSTCLAPTLTGRTEVWRGTITVGTGGTGSWGYLLDVSGELGELSDDDFDYGGNTYTIRGIIEGSLPGYENELLFNLDSRLPDSDQGKLRLHFCSDTFDLTTVSEIRPPHIYVWDDALLDWSGASMIEAALSATTTVPEIVTVQVTSTPAAGDTYGRGETIAITVTFDNAVTVDTSGGTPRIRFILIRGGNPVVGWAEYSSGSGGTALEFTYTVQAGDMDDEGIWLPANYLELQSGTIRAAADPTVDATLTYAQPGTQSGHKVDGSLTTADATLSALALSGVTLDPTFVSSTETYTATVVNGVTETTVTATPTHPDATVAFKDGADNALTNPVTLAVGATVIKAVVTAQDGTTTKTYMVTVTRAPKIVTVQVTSNPMATGDTYGRGETIEITVTFDNAVTVDTSGGRPRIAFHLDGGLRWAVYSSGSGDTALVFTYTVLADDRAVNGILLRGDQFDLFGGTIRAAPDNAVDATLTYADPGLQSGTRWTARSPTMTTGPRRPRSSPTACRSPRRRPRATSTGWERPSQSRSPSSRRSRWTRPAARAGPGSRSTSTGI